MAFILQNFQFGRGILTAATQGQGYTTVAHSYKSSDTLATINADDYFPAYIDGEGDKIFIGDLLDICASDGTSRVRINSLSPFAYGADLYSASGSSLVVGAPEVGSSGDGANIDLTTLHMEYANATNPGILSTSAQTIAGDKTFSGTVIANSGVIFGASSPSDLSYYEEGEHVTTFFNNTIVTSPITIQVVRIGVIVNFTINAAISSGAQGSPASSFTATTPLPAKWRPAGDHYGYWPVSLNGTNARGQIFIGTDGGIQIFADVDETVLFGNTANVLFPSCAPYNIAA